MADTECLVESLEALQIRHRKEQRDLVSRITQKRKQATKKTRKGVNDECERLEREQNARQEAELAALTTEGVGAVQEPDKIEVEPIVDDTHPSESSQGIMNPSLESITEDAKEGDVSRAGNTGMVRPRKPNRAKARLARRAAEQAAIVRDAEVEAANAPDPRVEERERMVQHIQKRELRLHEIRADGHCLYAAVADQLQTRELNSTPRIRSPPSMAIEKQANPTYKLIRYAAADWIEAHGEDFVGFMEDSLPEHVRKIRETGEWGGHLELLALANTYGIEICVLHSDGRVDPIRPKAQDAGAAQIWLGYFKHSHGLGEHYNSLRRAG